MKETTTDSYSHILKYMGLFGGVQGLSILVSLVRSKLVALLLGPVGMGLASLFNTTVNFISQSTSLGISFSAVRHVSELFDSGDEEKIMHFVTVVRMWSLLTGLIGMLFCVAVGPLLSNLTFSWGDHSLHFMLLAPAVFMLAIAGGETAILKGARRLKSLVLVQVKTILASLMITVPIYYLFGQAGIVPVIVLTGGASLLFTVGYSYRLYPLRLSRDKGIFSDGLSMVRLGVSFTLAGIIGSASEVLIRSFLNIEGSLNDVGLFNAGYMIAGTYAGMVFSALETDYFPRLSSVNHDIAATNQTVNKQMEVSMLILAPMLAALIMFLPIAIPLLFSNEFLDVVTMTQVAMLAMYLKVMTLPVAYITLARGYSLSFLMLESAYYVVFVLLVVWGYRHYGLWGTGAAMVGANLFDYLMINGYAYWQYGYRCTVALMGNAAVQMCFGLLAYVVSCQLTGWAYWGAEAAVVLSSLAFSLCVLRRKTHLWSALKRHFTKKCGS